MGGPCGGLAVGTPARLRKRADRNNSQPIGPSSKTITTQPARGPRGQVLPGGGRQGPEFADSAT